MKIAKVAYLSSRAVVELLGMMMLFILVAYSIVYIKGGAVEDTTFPLGKLLTGDMPYIWCVILPIYLVGLVVKAIIGFKQSFQKAKETASTSDKVAIFWEWFKKN